VSQEAAYGLVVSLELSGTPSTRNWTLDTPMLSLAEAATVTIPPTVDPLLGAVSATVGGTVSGTNETVAVAN
jgi:hypothetical protein